MNTVYIFKLHDFIVSYEFFEGRNEGDVIECKQVSFFQ